MMYRQPKNKVHRDFLYLDDEVTVNSLSALEAGKIDEIVDKTMTLNEGALNGKIGISHARVGGERKTTGEVQQEMVRTRTRFSVFDAWYKLLEEREGLGIFDDWGEHALVDISSGDTVEFKTTLSIGDLQTVLQMFYWYAEEVGKPNSVIASEIKKEEKDEMLRTAKMLRESLKACNGADGIPVVAKPYGGEGPEVLLLLRREWLIGEIDSLAGDFNVVGQVTELLSENDEYPILRLMHGVPPTSFEIDMLKDLVGNFQEAAKQLGLGISSEEVVITGPAMILKPIAIYK